MAWLGSRGGRRHGVQDIGIRVDTATPVQFSVHADELLVSLPGQTLPARTVDKLNGKHASRRSSPNIANVFLRASQIEAWGRVPERSLAACRETHFTERLIDQEPTE